MNFLGIYREPACSPGRHLSNDTRILRLVGQALEKRDVRVRLATLDEARPLRRKADLIFSMCQGPDALTELTEWKNEGLLIHNDPEAARRTYRDFLCATEQQERLGLPKSVILDTDKPGSLNRYLPFLRKNGAWLKRADVHSTQDSDVVRVETLTELAAGLAALKNRGLPQAVLQQHCDGDEVKFYAVGGRMFWPYYPRESEGFPFDETTLQTLAGGAARALGLTIYGGDAIVSPNGALTLIDLNDWPSFAPCRGAAAYAIAQHLEEQFLAAQKQLARS